MEMDIAKNVVMAQAILITMIIRMEFIKEILTLMGTQEEVAVTSYQAQELIICGNNLKISLIFQI